MTTPKATPRDVFFHVGSAILLYISVGSLLALLFEYINILVPDVLNPVYRSGSSLAFPLATTIVVFPVYIWIMASLYKDGKAHPEKEELGVRKWLVYFTLFLAAALVIGDAIFLISRFLGGELTLRFLLKAFALLIIAGSVFGYYFYELKRAARRFSGQAKMFTWATCGIVLVIVIAGFFLGGSPFTQREIRLDVQRVQDLQVLQNQIITYWNRKDEIPATLDSLRDDISGFVPPTDPQTNEPYTYRKTDTLSFDLCADFIRPSEAKTISYEPFRTPGDNWEHEAGIVCFSRTIDPELHKQEMPVRF